MNAAELSDHFRCDVVDKAAPYLWSKTEVLRYMNDAYRMFVRLIGGVPDFTSSATRVQLVEAEPISKLHPSILRINSAQRESDSGKVEIINYTDLAKLTANVTDYGHFQTLKLDMQQGPVRYGVIGMQRNQIRWLKVPMVDDVVNLIIYRLPFSTITDFDQEFDDVDEDHHLHLVDWMKYLAYSKQDADTFDAKKAVEYKAAFEGYCGFVRGEMERYKSKVRSVAYGGL